MDHTSLVMDPDVEEGSPETHAAPPPRLVTSTSQTLLPVRDVVAGGGGEDSQQPHPFLNGTPAFSLFDKDGDGKVHRADLEQAAEVQQNLDGVFTPERMVQLFEEMDTEKRGYIEVEQAVRWIEEHPDAMKDKHKTALLQQSAPALVEQRAAAAEARRAAE